MLPPQTNKTFFFLTKTHKRLKRTLFNQDETKQSANFLQILPSIQHSTNRCKTTDMGITYRSSSHLCFRGFMPDDYYQYYIIVILNLKVFCILSRSGFWWFLTSIDLYIYESIMQIFKDLTYTMSKKLATFNCFASNFSLNKRQSCSKLNGHVENILAQKYPSDAAVTLK